MLLDHEQYAAIVRGRDPRYDGRFFTAVTTTKIYCRPSCPARTPDSSNMQFYLTAAAAQSAGFRACKRCRPDATPGSSEWSTRSDLVARAMRSIRDGVVDRDGVPGLARSLGYSVRQLERILQTELGAGPLGIARAARAQSARTLLESSDLSASAVAFAAGFTSVRTFNETIRSTYDLTPSELRERSRARSTARHHASDDRANAAGASAAGVVHLRLPFRAPLEPSNLYGHLIATMVPGVEEWRDNTYRAAVRLPHAPGILELGLPVGAHVPLALRLDDVRDVQAAVSRARHLLDLDADPELIDASLAEEPTLAPLVASSPGRRVPHILDPESFAIRAVLGQQVSTKAAQTHAGRLVQTFGTPVEDPHGGLTHLFPSAATLLEREDAVMEHLAMPQRRKSTLLGLVRALAEGRVRLHPGADWAEARSELHALPGIGPWTVETILMRALGDPNAFVANDLGVILAARSLGLPDTAAGIERFSTAWSPWRSYAVQHLWATGTHASNTIPDERKVEQA
ncbi:AlkA N-terminal domain-containing protein [Humidisolicoccus flavus]|uniref:DNA-3-methyladenine glycosylase 2 family protein n=1 Tax=Humidisolicoccus flavus TaxID=3111414 RepID=UPI00324EC05D